MPKDSAQVIEILKKVVKGRLKKSEAANLLGISRKTLYKWLKSFKVDSLPRTVEKEEKKMPSKGTDLQRGSRKELESVVIHIIVANPEFGPQKIAKELEKKGKKLSARSIWLTLSGLGLQTGSKRQAYASNFRKSTQAADPQNPVYLRLNAFARKRMVEARTLSGEKVNKITRQFQVSRKTFAKWKNRYLAAKTRDEAILPALEDQNLQGPEHPRGVEEKVVQAVLDLVASAPELSTHKIAGQLGFIGNHGVQNILARNNLSHLEQRLRFAKEYKPVVQPVPAAPAGERVRSVWPEFTPNLAPAPPPPPKITLAFFLSRKNLPFTASGLLFSLSLLVLWIRLLGNYSFMQAIGLSFAGLALLCGMFFFLYSLKYYLTLAVVLSFSQRSARELAGEKTSERGVAEEIPGKKGVLNWLLGSGQKGKSGRFNPVGLEQNLDHVRLGRYPKVCIQIPFYNERNVAERAITAACNLDYPEYEVIVADDSTDVTPEIIRNYQKRFGKLTETSGEGWTLTSVQVKKGVTLKHLHRANRSGFKGAALNLALKLTDPEVEFISIFDADFVPYPDSLTLFLKYFKLQNNMSEDYTSSNVAVVQGYQWHVLNKSENWITRGVRSEYAGSYVIERAGTELYGGLKMISGSVYMIRRKPLEEAGWGASITEDFELTLRLYERGYKVVYTPYIQAPAECVSTLKRMIRQRMRWSEGHSFNTKLMFKRLLFSKNLTRAEKLEFLYLSPYYLQALFFIIGTFAWLVSETIFKVSLPFWTSLWGWSLVLTNLLSLPLINTVGLFLEESEQKDYVGIASFVALSYLVVPFQAYAALKGFMEEKEGTWFRTPKSGRITDVLTRGTFIRLVSGVLSGIKPSFPSFGKASMTKIASSALSPNLNPYLALSTANNRFNNFKIRPKRAKWIGKVVLSSILILAVLLNAVSFDQFLAPKPLNSREKQEFAISGKDSFSASQTPKFVIYAPKKSDEPWFKKILGPKEVKAAEPEVKTSVLNARGEEVKGITPTITPTPEGFSLSIPETKDLKPGKYTLKATYKGEDGQTYQSQQDFSWGVLAINPNKSIYLPGETAQLGFGVLTDQGRTACDARITLDITDPQGINMTQSTENGQIKRSGKCQATSVTNVPDYLAGYKVGKPGIYKLHLEANNGNGIKSLDDSFEVRESVPFDIERSDYPMRIYPPAEYQAKITIKANQDFKGEVQESVPASFDIKQSTAYSLQTTAQEKRLTWNVDWKKGEKYELQYSIKFPMVSPEWYLVGPLTLSTSEESPSTSLGTSRPTSEVFRESRQWQIASDVVATQFMESGTDATQAFQFWSTTGGTGTAVSSDTTVAKTGPRSIKSDTGAGNGTSFAQLSSGIADTGTRVSAYYYFTDFPNASTWTAIMAIKNSGYYQVATVRVVGTSGKLQLINGTATLGTGTTVLSAGSWYRISLAYVINSTTSFTMTVWLNGNQEISVTDSTTLVQTGGDKLIIGYSGNPGANKVLNVDDIYVDNDTTGNTDTGDIRVTAKLPASDNSNSFDTVIGSDPGTGNHYQNVDDRPLDTTLGWRQNATTQVRENFGIQAVSAGDVDFAGNTQVAYVGWINARSSANDMNGAITVNGTDTTIATTTTAKVFPIYVDSATYPSNAATIGMLSTGTANDTLLNEAGIVFAFTGDPVPEAALFLAPLAPFAPKIAKSIRNGTLLVDLADLARKVWEIIKKTVGEGWGRVIRVCGRKRGERRKKKVFLDDS